VTSANEESVLGKGSYRLSRLLMASKGSSSPVPIQLRQRSDCPLSQSPLALSHLQPQARSFLLDAPYSTLRSLLSTSNRTSAPYTLRPSTYYQGKEGLTRPCLQQRQQRYTHQKHRKHLSKAPLVFDETVRHRQMAFLAVDD